MDPAPYPELSNTLFALMAISLASLFGSVSFAFGRKLQAALPYLLAVASGILIATAATHLLPEAIEQLKNVRYASLLFLVGLVGSFLLERLFSLMLQPVGGEGHVHERDSKGATALVSARSLTTGIVLSGAVHSFVDGVAITVAFAVGHNVGIATTLAVFLHEVPHHIANVGVLIYAGMSRGQAALLNLLATCGCAAGGVLVLLLGLRSAAVTVTILPMAAANFLYIGLVILLPEMQRERDWRRSVLQMIGFSLAATAMAALSYWEPA